MASCPGTMWWLFLWGALQVCPTWSRVLLARRLPQTLMPPRYPEPYLKGQECAADIRAPEGLAVKLVFQDFDLEPSPHSLNNSQPMSQASGGSEAISAPAGSPSEAHCQEPYYQAVPAGTLTCAAPGTWKDAQGRVEVPQCVPVCGRPVTPLAQSQEARGSLRAEPGSFPWQALTNIHGRAGGALLGDRWVLTAAHTLYPKDHVSQGRNLSVGVFLGHTHAEEMIKLGSHPVRRVAVHPDYRQHEPGDFDGDIALLELEKSVPLGAHLLPVCLPSSETQYRRGTWGYVSGFGVENGRFAPELKYFRLPVAPRKACEAWLRERGRTEVFSENMFCVGETTRRQGVCQGDSGGAFVVWDDLARRWVATGIVSWGIGCGKGYDFYTKVLNYVDWIRAVMEGTD
ncbi:complement C1r subcomponent-like protein isoform X2 [Dasypus novemcinctus]|uniref:complement C1r subcomponent-like protein isoform X2 n=1 Tax=Dasypus novemcinctus TaxID=9361 RepID=UPI00265DB84F|nr:complement C1r subcomponent-like protein isoform X2 [Dasypus novemcinctus]